MRRKLLLFFTCMMTVTSMQATGIVLKSSSITYTSGEYYIMDKTSGLFVAFDETYTTSSETNVKNAIFTSEDAYKFDATWDSENQTLVFSHEVDGTTWYIGQSTKCSWNFGNTAQTAWTVEDAGDGLVYLKGTNGYWKGDATTTGQYYYTDGQLANARKFQIIATADYKVNTIKLEYALKQSENYAVGDIPLINYKGLTAEEWSATRTEAQEVLDNEEHTQSEVNAAATKLNSAFAKLTLVEPENSCYYYLKHYTQDKYLNLSDAEYSLSDTPTPLYFTKYDNNTQAWYINASETVFLGYCSTTTNKIPFYPVASAYGLVSLKQNVNTTLDCFGWEKSSTGGGSYILGFGSHPADENSRWTVEIKHPTLLEASDIAIDKTTCNPGEDITISWKVTNSGDLPGIAGWEEQIYLKDSDGKELYLGKVTEESDINGAETIERSQTYTIPSMPGTDGLQTVIVKVVANNGNSDPAGFAKSSDGSKSDALTIGTVLSVTPEVANTEEKDNSTLTFTLTRSGKTTQDEDFEVTTAGDSRLSIPTTVTIASGQASKDFTISVTADGKYNEANDAISISLSNTRYTAATSSITIIDDAIVDEEWTAISHMFSSMKDADGNEVFSFANMQAMLQDARVTYEKGHITSLDLSGLKLVGSVPEGFSQFTKLGVLNLSNNALTSIPVMPESIQTIDITNQKTGVDIQVNFSNPDKSSIFSAVPNILLYDTEARTYAESLLSSLAFGTQKRNLTLSATDLTLQAGALTYAGKKDSVVVATVTSGAAQGSTFSIKMNFEDGDANFGDGVDATDLQATILYAFDEYGSNPFNFTAADTYKDSKNRINVQDVVCTANLLLAQEEPARSAARSLSAQGEETAQANLFVRDGKVILYTSVPIAALTVQADGGVTWNLSQYGLTQTTKEDRVVGYSLSGDVIPAGENIIGTCSGATDIASASMSDAEAQKISVSLKKNSTTGIDGLNGLNGSNGSNGLNGSKQIYDLGGRKHADTFRGINIIKSNNKYTKVIK